MVMSRRQKSPLARKRVYSSNKCFLLVVLPTLSLLSSADSLLITFANSWNPDKDRQNLGLDLDPSVIAFLKEYFEKVNFEKSQQTTAKE